MSCELLGYQNNKISLKYWLLAFRPQIKVNYMCIHSILFADPYLDPKKVKKRLQHINKCMAMFLNIKFGFCISFWGDDLEITHKAKPTKKNPAYGRH